MMSKAVKSKFKRKINGAVVAIIVLSVCLAVSAFALAYETLVVDSNVFRTGTVKININDGVPVIREGEYLFEPGMTVIKEFFVENQSTWDVYYRLYLANVSGDIADILELTLKEGDTVIFTGTARELENSVSASGASPLAVMEKRTLTITFYYPPQSGNEGMECSLSFDLCVEAVQTKNNPDKAFS